MILKITHNTHYQFTMPQVYALQQLRLRPINKPGVTILNWQLSVTGGDQQLSYKDQHKNQVDLVLVSAGSETLIIHCEGEVQTDNLFGIMGEYSLHGPTWLYEYGSSLTYPGPLIKKLARSMRNEACGDVELLHNLSSRILEEFINSLMQGTYFISYFPVDVRFSWVFFILFSTIILTLLVCLYPARIASKVIPAEVLRNE